MQMALRLSTVAVCLCLISRMPYVKAAGQCKSQSSNYSKALKRHTFGKLIVNSLDVCIKSCQNEPRCQSINYDRKENICELNDRSKETRPEDYVTDPGRIYLTVSLSKGTPFHWTLDGSDKQLNFHGAAKFVVKNGKTVLYLDGTKGTYAETSAIPFQQTDMTIAVWIKLVSPLSKRNEIYADWSSPHQFRLGINSAGRLCFQARRTDKVSSDMINACTGSGVDTDVWRHVAITWGRVNRKVKLYVNGNVKLDQLILDYPVLDFKNSGHSVYDIGLKRDTASTTHAYFSDLIIFTHELSGAEVKNELFANHHFAALFK